MKEKMKEMASLLGEALKNLIEYIEKTGQMRDAQIEAIKV